MDEKKEIVNDRLFEEVMGSDINEKDREFVLRYLETYNAAQSYKEVFGEKGTQAKLMAYAKLQRQDIRSLMRKMKKILQVGYNIDPSKYIEFLLKGAGANIGDYLSFGEEEVEVRGKDGEQLFDLDTGQPLTKKVSKVRFKSSEDVDMSLIKSVSQGRDGIKVELIDKVKCWEKLRDFFDWKAEADDKDEVGSNIIDAINNSTKKVWSTDPDKDLEEALED